MLQTVQNWSFPNENARRETVAKRSRTKTEGRETVAKENGRSRNGRETVAKHDARDFL